MLVTSPNAPLAGAIVKEQLENPYNIAVLIVSGSKQRCYSILLVYKELMIGFYFAVSVKGN